MWYLIRQRLDTLRKVWRILPSITFIGSCTIIPKEFTQTFKNIVYEFLWKGKKDSVKRSVLSNDYLKGGLKMTNIDTVARCVRKKKNYI